MGNLTDPDNATALTLKKLAVRYPFLEREILDTDPGLAEIFRDCAPLLWDVPGVGIEVASQLLVTVGDDPERIATEAQFAAFVGVAAIPASSGKTSRHRLSRGGERAANAAIHHVVVSRLATDSRTREYAARRTAQSKTKKEIMRWLKRYVSRELYRQLTNPQAAPSFTDLRTAHQELHITLREAAGHFNTWPGTFSRIERGLSRDDNLASRFRDWLHEEKETQDIN